MQEADIASKRTNLSRLTILAKMARIKAIFLYHSKPKGLYTMEKIVIVGISSQDGTIITERFIYDGVQY